MSSRFLISNKNVHVWRIALSSFASQELTFFEILSKDEIQRAERFHFPQHRLRFIIARGMLRNILALYTGFKAKDINFIYGPRGKPYLSSPNVNIQFNVSHSEDVAVIALAQYEVGIDIEKIKTNYHEGIAERFFSDAEQADLALLSKQLQPEAFYQLWAYKEALIKVTGAGLYVPLGDFTVSWKAPSQAVELNYQGVTQTYYLQNIKAFIGYCSALAMVQKIEGIQCWEWVNGEPQNWENGS
jgi:4'-phosphopantetheinyl transferase